MSMNGYLSTSHRHPSASTVHGLDSNVMTDSKTTCYHCVDHGGVDG